ncbi:hypothetical protein AAVH_22198 [Aphelenchoides avenae]|nr:hypothetical protein AAVH_22198 [Aphelenchus avenae]
MAVQQKDAALQDQAKRLQISSGLVSSLPEKLQTQGTASSHYRHPSVSGLRANKCEHVDSGNTTNSYRYASVA